MAVHITNVAKYVIRDSEEDKRELKRLGYLSMGLEIVGVHIYFF